MSTRSWLSINMQSGRGCLATCRLYECVGPSYSLTCYFSSLYSIKGSYTKEEGMQLIETAKIEQLLKIALSHAHALKIIIVVMDIECT